MPEVSDIFSRIETDKSDVIDTKSAAFREVGAHKVLIPEEARAKYIELNPYQQFCWRTLGPLVRKKATISQDLEENLLKAHMRIRPEEYVAYVWMNSLIAAGVSVVISIVFGGVILGILGVNWIFRLLAGIAPFLLPVAVYFLQMSSPSGKAKARGRNIDKNIANAMSFISAMASANVTIDTIFKELARQETYGEIKNEAEWITRDTELLGIDILTALSVAATRTPSTKFQDFLQGVVTTSTSGGQLKPYFLMKADQYEKEDKLEEQSRKETLGLLAESFVTVVVAFPLFLVVILAIMAIVGGNGEFNLQLLYAVVGLMIPLSQFGFIFAVWNASQEG